MMGISTAMTFLKDLGNLIQFRKEYRNSNGIPTKKMANTIGMKSSIMEVVMVMPMIMVKEAVLNIKVKPTLTNKLAIFNPRK